jgi:hypothetical protein
VLLLAIGTPHFDYLEEHQLEAHPLGPIAHENLQAPLHNANHCKD